MVRDITKVSSGGLCSVFIYGSLGDKIASQDKHFIERVTGYAGELVGEATASSYALRELRLPDSRKVCTLQIPPRRESIACATGLLWELSEEAFGVMTEFQAQRLVPFVPKKVGIKMRGVTRGRQRIVTSYVAELDVNQQEYLIAWVHSGSWPM
jgi:hypothetical protein